ncbi:peroxiredoxin-like family protein [Qipengyuania sp. DY56-A-20]|jgi:peroxiredoxin|uniref:Peroxiredoxin-like family protein n=1 Tax=Qipengyuania benthica TaxID=3067651 RepID=A0ABT9H7D0_9SPHN|nr:peroxiredoxin-like family protein [Qipengyuania sp. DY56-A-20]MBU1253576.1 AhpC/TSA family protein [Alphaproteobacteria bacterium]MBU1605387.1 AhpC/TSA family protein [Alphaproteobacteria bacterium]MDP4539226.1 peroxiredoxin-like family protein [Qipengyuania sp. DY56-A-20]
MLTPATTAPDLDLPLTIDARFVLSDQRPDAFTMLVFYRGSHCPICKRYLTQLGGRLEEFTRRGINVFAVSMDSPERAASAHKEWDTRDLPLAHSLSEDQARQWGLFLSQARPDSEEPEVFSEPALFLLKPDRSVYFEVVQSAPFTRPDLDQLLESVDFIAKQDYPTRGTLT